jgi:antitoxin (DNA-binding transcriptional repressor) of toxin-antitoxin stability system
MCYMLAVEAVEQVGVRELRQNLSVYLARIALGETLEVTDRGQPVAILAPLPKPTSVLERLKRDGRLTPARGDVLALKRPPMAVSRRGTKALELQRKDRRL